MNRMKTATQTRGIALVLVLAFLALISVFVIGFFSSASGELTASTSYAAGITTRQLADSTVNLIEGQIREATTRLAPDALDHEKDFDAWASQPGMIRTFRGGPNASPDTTALYKLYSSDQMVVDSLGEIKNFRSAKDVPPGGSGWYSQPALFTDINEPVSVVNPTNPAQNIDRYPVFDPKTFNAPGTPEDPDNAPPKDKTKIPGTELTNDDELPQNRQGRMPVRWLYVLRDGTVAAPSTDPGNGGKTATFTTDKPHPTPENPIVGRIAFWTDDDTSKVNINTAGGYNPLDVNTSGARPLAGSYWDVPRYNTNFDRGQINDKGVVLNGDQSLALSQPAGGEFQRYPGHPATTSLGLVLRNQLTTSTQLYNLTPRYVPSGRNEQNYQAGSDNGRNQTRSEKDAQMLPKWDRLYSSVDEMIFAFSTDQASDDKQKGSGQRARELNNTKNTLIQADQVDRLRFFLTAHSRAPELNLFGRPRISLWPMWPVFGKQGMAPTYPHNEHYDVNGNDGIKKTVPYGPEDFRKLMNSADRLLAFCSMIGNGLDDPKAKVYMFQRYNPYSSTDDWSMPRNTELLKMLTEFTSTKIPGYGGTFSDPNKFGKDHTQIITEMFDYIRCINLRDSTNDVKPNLDPEPPQQLGYAKNTYKYAPRGIVVPSVVTMADKGFDGTTGFGRYPTISEVAVVFYHAGYFGFEKWRYDPKAPNPPPGGTVAPANQKYVQNDINNVPMSFHYDRNDHSGRGKNTWWVLGKMISCFLAIETFNPMQGYSSIDEMNQNTEVRGRKYAFIHQIEGLNSFAMSSASLKGSFQSFNMPNNASNAYRKASTNTWSGRSSGGYEGFIHPFMEGLANPGAGAVSPLKMLSLGAGSYAYPFQATPAFPASKNVIAQNGDPKDLGPGFEDRAPMVLGTVPNPANTPGRILPPVTLSPQNGVLIRNSDDIMHFKGGTLTMRTKWGAEDNRTINEFILKFPNSPAQGWPMPTDNIWNPGPVSGSAGQFDSGGFRDMSIDPQNPATSQGTPGRAGWVLAAPELQFTFHDRVKWSQAGTWDPVTSSSTSNQGGQGIRGMFFGRRWRQMLQPGDTIRSLVPANPEQSGNPAWLGGDLRVLALLQPSDPNKDAYFQPHPYYNDAVRRHAHNLRAADGQYYITDFDTKKRPSDPDGNVGAKDPEVAKFQRPGGSNSYPSQTSQRIFKTDFGELVKVSPTGTYISTNTADLPPSVHGVKSASGRDPDYDGGTGPINDGPYTNKADEGVFTYKVWDSTNVKYFYMIPYYEGNYGSQKGFDAYFSPNRQISSAVQFGSLLTGRKKAWQTLAFSPNPMDVSHPGLSKEPKDHVLVDFFQMPVVEPYAISEPFSTAGKVNINYPIVPFNYIKRTTALRAALAPMRVTAVGPSFANTFKNSTNSAFRIGNPPFRSLIDRDKTVKLFDEFLQGGPGGSDERIFHSASDICEIFFYPMTASPTPTSSRALAKWWADQTLTADNVRERPYADLYPRITTKSNTFTVYMRVQTLRKRPLIGGSDSARNTAALQWNEGQDQVLSEYRGSATIERYLDPTDRRLTDTTRVDYIDPDKKSLEPVYRFRVIENKRFAPQ